MSEEREHAVLSASSAHKWLVCTPSARLEEQFPAKTSEYMEEGTLAHEIAEFKVRSYFLEPLPKATYTRRFNKLKSNELYQAEMDNHTNTYLDYVKDEALKFNTKPFIAVEQKVDFSDYVPEGFGTADCIMIVGDTLQIIDFKYGKGVKVEAEDNPQMKLYALGALKQYGMLFDIKHIKMTIVQPRLDNISMSYIAKEILVMWGDTIVKENAQKAYLGIGEFVKGEHCRFCKAKGACEFRAKENMKTIEEIQKTSGTISNDDLGEMLTKLIGIDDWLKDIRVYALEQILDGKDVKGWKAVEGRSNRVVTDIDGAFEVLEKNGFDEAMLYERKPLTLTGLEALVGKKKLTELIGNYIEKPQGKPSLVEESDKRESFKKLSAAEEFKEV